MQRETHGRGQAHNRCLGEACPPTSRDWMTGALLQPNQWSLRVGTERDRLGHLPRKIPPSHCLQNLPHGVSLENGQKPGVRRVLASGSRHRKIGDHERKSAYGVEHEIGRLESRLGRGSRWTSGTCSEGWGRKWYPLQQTHWQDDTTELD